MIFKIVKEAYQRPLFERVRTDIGTIFNNVMTYYINNESTAKSPSQKEELIDSAISNVDEKSVRGGRTDGAYELFGKLVSPLTVSIVMDGSDIEKNKFLKLLSNITDDDILRQRDSKEKLEHVLGLYRNGLVSNIDNDFYRNVSLYTNSLDDFRYIANAYALCTSRAIASKYFSDLSKIDVNEFLNEDGSIKSKQEIHDIIDKWYVEYGKEVAKEVAKEKNKDKENKDNQLKTSIDGLVDYLKTNKSRLVNKDTTTSSFIYDLAKKYYSQWRYTKKPKYDEVFSSKDSVPLDSLLHFLDKKNAKFTIQTDSRKIAEELFYYWGKLAG